MKKENKTESNTFYPGNSYKCIKTSRINLVTENNWYECVDSQKKNSGIFYFKGNNNRVCAFLGHHVFDYFDFNNPKNEKPN